jgi:hypothetical protein
LLDRVYAPAEELLETRQNADAYVYPMVEVFEAVHHPSQSPWR